MTLLGICAAEDGGGWRRMAEDGGGSEELATGGRLGLPQGGGRAGVTGASLNTGFRRSTETTSCLEPIWMRKYLLILSNTR